MTQVPTQSVFPIVAREDFSDVTYLLEVAPSDDGARRPGPGSSSS